MTHLDLGQSYIWNGEIFHGESKPRIDFNLLYPLPSSVSIMYCRHNSPSPPLQRKYRGRFGEKCLYGNNLAYYQWGFCFGTVSSFSTGFYSPIQSLPGRNRVTVIIQKKNSLITSNSKDSYLDSQKYLPVQAFIALVRKLFNNNCPQIVHLYFHKCPRAFVKK